MSAKALVAASAVAAIWLSHAAVAGSIIECGTASWYEQGTKTASGADFDPTALTAAHPSLPFGTRIRVENLDNGRSIELVIDDRGPFKKGRILDVTRAAAEKLDFIRDGVATVRVTLAGGKAVEGLGCRSWTALVRRADNTVGSK
jgi:rare lipoprotein A